MIEQTFALVKGQWLAAAFLAASFAVSEYGTNPPRK
jgi:hypothetical protein